MKMYSTVIWDLDGTLLYTLVDLMDSVNYSMRTLGYEERSLEDIRMFVGNGVKKLVELAIPDGRDNPDYKKAYDLFCEYYSEHNLDNTVPYDGVVEVIEELRRRGVKQAIVSNKIDSAVKKLNKTFFGVDIALGVTDSLPRKPAPDMVWKAVAELGADISTTVYVGDSEVDLKTAKNSKLDCISVLWGFRNLDEISPYGPMCTVENPKDILKFITK
ncbi:MAG: HAD family hydrolase [Clostridia bacterium]|nr:HAD family hydrolase [Clostridia bacterium]